MRFLRCACPGPQAIRGERISPHTSVTCDRQHPSGQRGYDNAHPSKRRGHSKLIVGGGSSSSVMSSSRMVPMWTNLQNRTEQIADFPKTLDHVIKAQNEIENWDNLTEVECLSKLFAVMPRALGRFVKKSFVHRSVIYR